MAKRSSLTMDSMLARIGADNDQDREAARKWMREASNAEKLAVWMTIQKPYADPAMEVMSRFAQLAFGEMLTEIGGTNGKAN